MGFNLAYLTIFEAFHVGDPVLKLQEARNALEKSKQLILFSRL